MRSVSDMSSPWNKSLHLDLDRSDRRRMTRLFDVLTQRLRRPSSVLGWVRQQHQCKHWKNQWTLRRVRLHSWWQQKRYWLKLVRRWRLSQFQHLQQTPRAMIHRTDTTVQTWMRGWQCTVMTLWGFSDDDGRNHIDKVLNSKYTAKDLETFGFEDSDAKSPLLLNREFRVKTDQTGHFVEPDLRHAPIFIKESGCSAKTQTSEHTTREIARQVCVCQEKDSNSSEGRCNTIQSCRSLVVIGPRQIRPCGNSKPYCPENE